MMVWLFSLAICLICLYCVVHRIYNWWTLPPGPKTLPFIGYLNKFDKKNHHYSLSEVANKYAVEGLSSVYVGTNTLILVSDFDVLKEMMSIYNFSGRPYNPFVHRFSKGCGIMFSEGENWTTQRRLTLQILRDFGFSRTVSVDMILYELDILNATFNDFCDCKTEGVHVLSTFQAATNNIIASLTLGNRFDQFDDEYKRVDKAVQKLVKDNFITNPQFLFPQLGFLTPILLLIPEVNRVVQDMNYMQDYFLKEINQRKLQLKPHDEPQCLCDSYILEQRKAEAAGDFETFKDLQITRVILEIFLAGTDTTARSMEWLLLYMCIYPHVQDKVHNEIVQTMGKERLPKLTDKQDLNYTSAVIDETYRLVSLAATGLFHRAMTTTTFRGYRIPSNATIFPLIHHIHNDSKYWESPSEFLPERFLSSDGMTYKPNSYLIPFLPGRRVCLGESLARMEIFLMFTFVMQKFQVRLHTDYRDKVKDIMEGSFGTLHMPADYRMIVSKR